MGSCQYAGKVLVLGNEIRSFLTVIRSLGRRNLCVHAGWFSPDSLALHSRYLHATHEIPRYSPESDAWKTRLIALMRREQFDLVIPTEDEAIIPLQLHRAELEPFGRIYLLGDKAFQIAFSKFRTNELARELGISLPREVRISEMPDLDSITSRFDFPLVLKPRASFQAEDLSSKRTVRKAYDYEELRACLESMLADGEVLIQENFIGDGVGVEVLADKGEILVAFQHQRIHEPLMGGGSSYRRSMPLHPELLEATSRMMRAMDYTGVAMVEFKMNRQTGEWVLIEINGRFWGSLPLSVAAGADFPYYLYRLLVHGERNLPKGYRPGIYCRNFSEDLCWVVQNAKAPHDDETLATLPHWRAIPEALHILTLRERNDTLVLDDPMPGLVEMGRIVRWTWELITRKAGLTLLSRPQIRRAQSARARKALRDARSVLFVCMGNICRSPFAEHFGRQVLPEYMRIKSCGYHPVEGRSSPVEAMAAAREFGVDLTEHRSQAISPELVRQADVIFTFDEDNRRSVLSRFPEARSKTFRIGLLDPQGPAVIRDPFGGTVQDYREIYGLIAQALDASRERSRALTSCQP